MCFGYYHSKLSIQKIAIYIIQEGIVILLEPNLNFFHVMTLYNIYVGAVASLLTRASPPWSARRRV